MFRISAAEISWALARMRMGGTGRRSGHGSILRDDGDLRLVNSGTGHCGCVVPAEGMAGGGMGLSGSVVVSDHGASANNAGRASSR